MTTTKVPDVLDYLVTTFRASALLGAAAIPVTIVDGPAPVPGPLPAGYWVGCDDPLAAAEGAEPTPPDSIQDWAGLGRLSRNETVTVPCCAAAWTGDVDEGFSPLRAVVKAILAAVEDIVRTDTTAPVLFPDPGVTGLQWRQIPRSNNGLHVLVPHQIIYKARIGG